MENNLLALKGITKHFKNGNGTPIQAVHNSSLTVKQGEWIGIVGESGCGKSTLARIICHLVEIDEGCMLFKGQDVTNINKKMLREFYKSVQMIFQDPLSTFSPRMRIGEYVSEPFINFKLLKKKEAAQYAKELLKLVGLPADFTEKYPHELSGGQLQRVVIARAVGVKPDLIICDEITSALDVSIQQQIMQLLIELKNKNHFSNLFITHDLALAESVCDRIYVMHAGEIVEVIESHHIVRDAQHPYTKKLISAGFSLQMKIKSQNGIRLEHN